jgi:hypothetical protein
MTQAIHAHTYISRLDYVRQSRYMEAHGLCPLFVDCRAFDKPRFTDYLFQVCIWRVHAPHRAVPRKNLDRQSETLGHYSEGDFSAEGARFIFERVVLRDE